MGYKFVPNETFEAEIYGNTNRYKQGHLYTVHDTPAHAELGSKVQQWVTEGKVVIVGATNGRSRPALVVVKDPEE